MGNEPVETGVFGEGRKKGYGTLAFALVPGSPPRSRSVKRKCAKNRYGKSSCIDEWRSLLYGMCVSDSNPNHRPDFSLVTSTTPTTLSSSIFPSLAGGPEGNERQQGRESEGHALSSHHPII